MSQLYLCYLLIFASILQLVLTELVDSVAVEHFATIDPLSVIDEDCIPQESHWFQHLVLGFSLVLNAIFICITVFIGYLLRAFISWQCCLQCCCGTGYLDMFRSRNNTENASSPGGEVRLRAQAAAPTLNREHEIELTQVVCTQPRSDHVLVDMSFTD